MVDEAVGGFTAALFEAIVIVLLASAFISLGVRAGLVVAISIPLVLADHLPGHAWTSEHFAATHLARRADHRARPPGRRRDDHRRDDGGAAGGRRRATQGGDPVYTSTAFPMLTGTLVTVAGFSPDRPQRQRGGRVHLHACSSSSRSRCWCPGSSRCCSRRCSASPSCRRRCGATPSDRPAFFARCSEPRWSRRCSGAGSRSA